MNLKKTINPLPLPSPFNKPKEKEKKIVTPPLHSHLTMKKNVFFKKKTPPLFLPQVK
jgi:hypothetical protein